MRRQKINSKNRCADTKKKYRHDNIVLHKSSQKRQMEAAQTQKRNRYRLISISYGYARLSEEIRSMLFTVVGSKLDLL